MSAVPSPVDELARLRSLHALDILDSPPDPEFDAFVRAAAAVCGAPVSLITLIDAERQWFKAATGVENLTETPRSLAFCEHTIFQDGLHEVPDMTCDPRFADHPFVTGELGVRFYAGAPLRLSDGAKVGSLCVLDRRPRQLDAGQRDLLLLLATAAAKALESRCTVKRFEQAVDALQRSEDTLKVLLNTSPIGIFLNDTDAQSVYVNPQLQEILGLEFDQCLGLGWLSSVHPDDVAAMQAQSLAANPRLDQRFVHRVLRSDGTVRTVEVSKRPIFDTHQQVSGYVGAVEDATERLATTARLAASEQQMRWLHESIPAMSHSIDAEGRIMTVSDRWLARMGYSRDEVVGRPASEFALPAAPDLPTTAPQIMGLSPRITKLFAEGQVEDLPVQMMTRSGELIEGLLSAVLERDPQGRPLRGIAVIDDVTERIAAERSLDEERHRLASLIEATLAGTWEWNRATGEARYNERWAAIIGYTLEELGPQSIRTWEAHCHPDDLVRVGAALEAYFSGATPVYEIEARMRHRDGHWVWVLSRGRLLSRTPEGEPEWLFGTHLDLTQRKRQEECLRKSESFLKRTGKVAGIGGWEYCTLTDSVFWSDELYRMLDIEPGAVLSIPKRAALYPKASRRVLKAALERARTQDIGWDIEIEMFSAIGRRLWIRSVAEVEFEGGRQVRLVGSLQDISALVAQRHAAEQAKERLALATESGSIGIWEFDFAKGRILLDALTCAAYGVPGSSAALTYEEWQSHVHPDDVVQLMADATSSMKGESKLDVEFRVVWADGSIRHLRSSARATRDPQGRATRLVGACWDVTPLRRLSAELAEQHEMLRVTLQSIGDAVITTDAEGKVTWLNPIAERMTGWITPQAQGRPLAQVFHIVHEETRLAAENPVDLCLRHGTNSGLALLTLLLSRDGREYGIENSAAPIRNDHGEVFGAVLVFHDVTETRRLAGEMSYRAMHDALTGLVNRAEFEARLNRLLQKAHSDQSQHALLYIDLDQFKIVNDTCGHSVGDQLLQQMSKLLGEAVRSRDTVARLGGDEFAVILEHCPSEQAERIAQKICDRMNDFRFVHDTRRFRIGTSIGLVPLDARWPAIAGLMQAADTSCYAAKEAGRNRVHVWFDTDLAMRARQGETKWATRLEQGLDEGRFVLFAQRIEPIGSEPRGLHAEVLLRLLDTDGSLIAPGAFLPAAERFHLSSRLDHWVMRASIDALLALPDLARIDMLCVNLSGKSIGDRAFHRQALEILTAAGAPICERLCLEVTETAAVTNLADAALFIEQARHLGVRIALDDFGAGASSFGYLKTLKVDLLKIDGQFIQNVIDDPLDDAAVRCFVDVARVMGLKTVAEFVDRPQVLERLQAIGVDYAQGYLLHRPEPIHLVIGGAPLRAATPAPGLERDPVAGGALVA